MHKVTPAILAILFALPIAAQQEVPPIRNFVRVNDQFCTGGQQGSSIYSNSRTKALSRTTCGRRVSIVPPKKPSKELVCALPFRRFGELKERTGDGVPESRTIR